MFLPKTPAALWKAIQGWYGRRAVCVSICVVPTRFAHTHTPRMRRRGGRRKGVGTKKGARGEGGAMDAGERAAGGGTSWTGVRGIARSISTHTTSPTTMLPTLQSHSTLTTHLACTARTVDVASPFSSSSVVGGSTGAAFQCQLVGALGGHVVRVCQGALVPAVSWGQCWVCASSVPSFLMARMAAHGRWRRRGGAMVARDGVR
jgi:hypothetical protein